MNRFVALQELKEAAGVISPGDFVPGAENWPRHIQQANVNVGVVYDLHREVVLKGFTFAAHQREKGRLDELAKRGIAIVDDPDHKGWRMVVRVEGTVPTPEPATQRGFEPQEPQDLTAKKGKKPRKRA